MMVHLEDRDNRVYLCPIKKRYIISFSVILLSANTHHTKDVVQGRYPVNKLGFIYIYGDPPLDISHKISTPSVVHYLITKIIHKGCETFKYSCYCQSILKLTPSLCNAHSQSFTGGESTLLAAAHFW